MLILASQSPWRRELLGKITQDFIVRPTGCDEHFACPEPRDHVLELARRKARAALEQCTPGENDAIVAADTIVFLDGAILEKPASEAEARAMLTRLSGREHTVCTGVAVAFRGEVRAFCQETGVRFYDLSAREIADYVATGEPMDKAGAYGIQQKGALLVREIRGDYFNVVGLPIAALYRLLREMGVPLDGEGQA